MTRSVRTVKITAIALIILCAIAFIPMLTTAWQSHAAAKLKVSKTEASIEGYGQTVKIKAKGLKAKDLKKVKWSSSNEDIATVTPKGKTATITSVYNGSATITAAFKKQTADVEVEVTVSNPSVTGNYQAEGTVYSLLYQESAEVAALQQQAFALAKIRLDEAIEANGGTGDGLGIVTDIDSTIADDTCYVAGAVLDTAGRLALGLEPWNNDDWCGYYQAVATTADTVIPGAKEFLDYAYGKGVEFYYITNRPYYELDLTVKQLDNQGFFEKYADRQGLLDAYAVANDYQDYYYYDDPALCTWDENGSSVFGEGTYGKKINDTGKLEIGDGYFSVKDDFRVQVQGTWFDSDKTARRANAEAQGKKIVMYMGDSINDMVSDAESSKWGDHAKDFTRKQFNETRTKNASSDYWKDHWGKDFIVLPNATYGDWYKTTWAKGKDPEQKYDSSTREGQQHYIYDQIWAHSYLNTDKFKTWYKGNSQTGPDIQ